MRLKLKYYTLHTGECNLGSSQDINTKTPESSKAWVAGLVGGILATFVIGSSILYGAKKCKDQQEVKQRRKNYTGLGNDDIELGEKKDDGKFTTKLTDERKKEEDTVIEIN